MSTTITTPFDAIPDFGASPTISSVKDGDWSDPTVWSTGAVPNSTDTVLVANAVVCDVSGATAKTIAVSGVLSFDTATSTMLTVVNLLVYAGGELLVTEPAFPQTTNIVFADVPLDTVNDPSQYGNGLIALGKVSITGTAKTGFALLAGEPKAGDTVVLLAEPVSGWLPGDKILLPDSRQLKVTERGAAYTPQWEMPLLASVSADGLTLTLASPLTFSHLGYRDADSVLLEMAHAANMTRNVVIKSANPSGTRGHAFFTRGADVSIENAVLGGLGRTKNGATGPGNIEARHPINLHHLMGPTAVPGVPQFTVAGNVVMCPLDPMPYKWAIVLRDSHYGLVNDNVCYNWAGAGVVTVTGSETGNVIDHNLACRISGSGNRGEMGTGGDGFWFRGASNTVTNNVACCIQGKFGVVAGFMFSECYGFSYNLMGTDYKNVPNSPGADTSDPSQVTRTFMGGVPIPAFSGNVVYNSPDGMAWWWLGMTDARHPLAGYPGSTIEITAWNVWRWGIFAYQGSTLLVKPTMLADPKSNASAGLLWSDYSNFNCVVDGANVQGFNTGFVPSTDALGGTQTIQNSYLRNIIDVQMETPWSSAATPSMLGPRVVKMVNVKHAPLPLQSHTTIKMFWNPTGSRQCVIGDQLFVTSYNGVAGDNFQAFYSQQAAAFVMPQSTFNADGSPKIMACPVSGDTNAQSLATYGVCVAGAISPTAAHSRTGITGLVV